MSSDSKFIEEKEEEKFDALHPYPDIYYEEEEDIGDDEEDWCGDCESPLDECTCIELCHHGNLVGADCDACLDEAHTEPDRAASPERAT